MKRIIIGIVVVVFAAILIFGIGKTVSYLAGAKKWINDEVDENMPMSFEIKKIEALIEKEGSTIQAYNDKVCDIDGRATSLKKNISTLKGRLDDEKALLARIKSMLDEKKEFYDIGGRKYTYAEVNRDALARVEGANRIQKDIEIKEKLRHEFNIVIKEAKTNLVTARQRLTTLKGTLETLEARNANADIRLEVARLVNSIENSGFGSDSEIEKAVAQYESRVAQKERRASARLGDATSAGRIDYSGSIVTKEASAEIEHLLDENKEELHPECPEQTFDTND